MQENLIKVAIQEVQNPTLGVTEQYLEIRDLEIVNGSPQAERVVVKESENIAIVYFKIRGAHFRLAAYLKVQPFAIAYNVGTETYN